MKAVIYARYSSDNQTEASIEGQLRECKEFQGSYNAEAQANGKPIDCSTVRNFKEATTWDHAIGSQL